MRRSALFFPFGLIFLISFDVSFWRLKKWLPAYPAFLRSQIAITKSLFTGLFFVPEINFKISHFFGLD